EALVHGVLFLARPVLLLTGVVLRMVLFLCAISGLRVMLLLPGVRLSFAARLLTTRFLVLGILLGVVLRPLFGVVRWGLGVGGSVVVRLERLLQIRGHGADGKTGVGHDRHAAAAYSQRGHGRIVRVVGFGEQVLGVCGLPESIGAV